MSYPIFKFKLVRIYINVESMECRRNTPRARTVTIQSLLKIFLLFLFLPPWGAVIGISKNWLSLVHVIFALKLEIEALWIGHLTQVSVLMR